MEETMKQELRDWGADMDGVINRFMGNEALAKKFMIKFLSDDNFQKLGEYLQEGDGGEAFKCAHTLKGVAANLGFDSLLDQLHPLVEKLRGGSLEDTQLLYEKVKKKYTELCGILERYR